MPRRSSVGWLGCSRDESVPGSPSVRAGLASDALILRARKISSCTSHSLATAAAIDAGQRPADAAAISSPGARSRWSLSSPSVSSAIAANASQVDVVVDAHDGIDPAVVVGQRMVVEMLQRQLAEDRAGRFALGLVRGGQAGVAVAGLAAVGRAEQRLQPLERERRGRASGRVGFVGAVRHGDFLEGRQRLHGDTCLERLCCTARGWRSLAEPRESTALDCLVRLQPSGRRPCRKGRRSGRRQLNRERRAPELAVRREGRFRPASRFIPVYAVLFANIPFYSRLFQKLE